MKFQSERWADVFPELLPLLQMANDSLEPYADSMSLDMDYEAYAQMEDAGILHIITARLNGNLVGHHLILVSDDLRRKGVIQAQTDTIWMCAEFRDSGLVAFSEQYLQSIGAHVWVVSSRDVFDISDMWKSKGFKPIERLFVKKLEL